MKVELSKSIYGIPYSEIPVGVTFLKEAHGYSRQQLFIKTDRMGISGAMSVLLATGCAYSWKDEETGFSPVDAKVVLDG